VTTLKKAYGTIERTVEPYLDTIVAMMGVLLPSIVHGTLLHEAFAIDH
jgi:hypothetical protein